MKNPLPLQLINIVKSYKDGDKTNLILKDVTFTLKKGEITAVVGPSGSGKSTLLSTAGLLLTPDIGEVMVNGLNISSYSDSEKADIRLKEIGYIFQTSNLVPYLKVEEQLYMILKLSKKWNREQKKFADGLLENVEMSHRAKHYPHQLSGGERQRVAIARAFVNNPEIILADEPTASLDSARGQAVIELISKMVKEHHKAAMIVTHDQKVLPSCDRILYMNDGILNDYNEEYNDEYSIQ